MVTDISQGVPNKRSYVPNLYG